MNTPSIDEITVLIMEDGEHEAGLGTDDVVGCTFELRPAIWN
jgi:hypothetical protein